MEIKKIIFFGTTDFSVETLKAIINDGYEILAVITVPDRPAGRGLKIRESEVKQFAISHNLLVLQPEDMTDKEFQEKLSALKPDVQIVVAFRKLPTEVFTIPPIGTINLHASILPDYRGAAPINWAIINGETVTGITTFYINDKIDEGNILLQEKIEIGKTDTAGVLFDKLKIRGASLIVETLHKISDDLLIPIAQGGINNLSSKKAPKIQKSDCKIDWRRTGNEITHLIRGLSPIPGAFTELISPDGKKYIIKIFTSEYHSGNSDKQIGSVITDNRTFLHIVVKDGLVSLLNIQLTGKVKMDVSAFLRGFQLSSDFSVSAS